MTQKLRMAGVQEDEKEKEANDRGEGGDGKMRWY